MANRLGAQLGRMGAVSLSLCAGTPVLRTPTALPRPSPMIRVLRVFLCASTLAFGACQSDRADLDAAPKSVSTRPASLSTAGLGELRVSIPRLGDAGVSTDLRRAFLALPEVIQVLPNFSRNEVVLRTSGVISSARVMLVLQQLGLEGRVR